MGNVASLLGCFYCCYRAVKRGKGYEVFVLWVAFLTTAIGIISHLAWTGVGNEKGEKAYNFICDYAKANNFEEHCPTIALNYVFLTIISVGGVVAAYTYFWDYDDGNFSQKCRFYEMILQRLTSLLLVVGAAVYIVAAWQTSDLFKKVEVADGTWTVDKGSATVKYFAGSLAILQAILHIRLPRRRVAAVANGAEATNSTVPRRSGSASANNDATAEADECPV